MGEEKDEEGGEVSHVAWQQMLITLWKYFYSAAVNYIRQNQTKKKKKFRDERFN